jgi:hypothetical protein
MEANRSKLQFSIKKDKQKKFLLQFLVIKTLDPDSPEMLDPDKYPDPQFYIQPYPVILQQLGSSSGWVHLLLGLNVANCTD